MSTDHRRSLVLVRHAKSAWDDPTLDDHNRPLAPRGRRALPRLAAHLAGAPVQPELVLCSSARRTLDTLAGLHASLPAEAIVEIDGHLYGAGASGLLGRLRRVEDTTRAVMVVGHNPGVQDLAVLLAGEGDGEHLAQLARKFPTAAAVSISFDGSWGDLGAELGRIDTLFMPRPPRS